VSNHQQERLDELNNSSAIRIKQRVVSFPWSANWLILLRGAWQVYRLNSVDRGAIYTEGVRKLQPRVSYPGPENRQ
jgi:hypothetical protein